MAKRLLLLISVLAAGLLLPASVSAHTPIKDQLSDTGAIFYIDPDDDPVAGHQATLFFDVEDETFSAESSQVSLTIAEEGGALATVPTETANSTISGTYVFPEPGSYKIRLTIKQDGRTVHDFLETKQVSGGAAAGGAPLWANVGIAVTVLAAAFTAGMILSRRKAIQRYSKL